MQQRGRKTSVLSVQVMEMRVVQITGKQCTRMLQSEDGEIRLVNRDGMLSSEDDAMMNGRLSHESNSIHAFFRPPDGIVEDPVLHFSTN